jgi:hypothetical protein
MRANFTGYFGFTSVMHLATALALCDFLPQIRQPALRMDGVATTRHKSNKHSRCTKGPSC